MANSWPARFDAIRAGFKLVHKTQMARMFGVSRETYTRWTSGSKDPPEIVQRLVLIYEHHQREQPLRPLLKKFASADFRAAAYRPPELP